MDNEATAQEQPSAPAPATVPLMKEEINYFKTKMRML